MGNRIDTRIVLGSLRYKSAPNTDLAYQLPLSQTTKEIIGYERNSDINLQQVFDDERQASTIFRPTAKFSLIFKNAYSGKTNYVPFENNLYYLNAAQAAAQQCATGPASVAWTGLPQYQEFDFIRTDYNLSGYTQPPNNHLFFVPKSANCYNWNFYMSYAYDNDYNKNMQVIDKLTNQTITWVSGDGIPFVVDRIKYDGQNLISFRCPMKHGLSEGESVQLSSNFTYLGDRIFQVYSLGVGTQDSDLYVFNLVDIGYTGSTFNNGLTGTFKRVIIDRYSADTISKYYVRKHKILTNPEDAVMAKAAFEENIFGISKKYESSGYTPNKVARVSIKEGAQSYTLSFNNDVSIEPLLDNQKRPITELFFTVMWKGYFGWTTGKLKQGWEFNVTSNPTNKYPNSWWSLFNTLSDTQFTTGTWTGPFGNNFNYVNSLKYDDTLDGDFCEWNDFEQSERVISELYHKFIFNPAYFNIGTAPPPYTVTNPFGYYYKPHHMITTRVYSDYIEGGDIKNVVGIPNYAHFSTTQNEFIWRDIYSYGFIDTRGRGVDYPFLNGAHYPTSTYIFRIIPEGTNYSEQITVAQPLIDDCE
jgi:hypothetical protein